MKGRVHPRLLLALAPVVLGALAGCNRSEAATTGQNSQPVASAAQGKIETEHYVAQLVGAGPYRSGAEGTFTVLLETKGEYHVNDQYPYKFVPKEGDGVTYKGTVGKDAAVMQQTRVEMKVPFTPTKAGKLSVGGKLSLSVCSEKNCLMEKQDLELAIDVK